MIIKACKIPIITLYPGNTSLSQPAQFRRSQDFSISSNIIVDCSISLVTKIQWIITNCSSICSSSELKYDESIITTSNELYIPARTLDYGIYKLKIIVTMFYSPSWNSSSSVYIQINPSGITANLVEYGTSIITSNPDKDLIFNPGLYSTDSDSNWFNASVYLF